MKRFLLMSSLALLVSCVKEENLPYSRGVIDTIVSTTVSIDDLPSLIDNAHGYCTKAMDVNVDPVLEGTDTVMYIVNYQDGWDLISADTRVGVILASSETGSVSEDDFQSNEANRLFFANLKREIQDLKQSPSLRSVSSTTTNPTMPMSFTDENGRFWAYAYRRLSSSSEMRQDPLLQTKWGQGSPSKKWNISAPYVDNSFSVNCLTGCTMVAAAQVLYYLHSTIGRPVNSYALCVCLGYIHPNHSSYVIRDDDVYFENLTDCWSAMPLSSGAYVTEYQYSLVSNLMVHLGWKLGAEYKETSTGAFLDNIGSVFRNNYGVNCTVGSFNMNTLVNEIYYYHNPVIFDIYGYDPSVARDVGHTVVGDGFKKVTESYEYVYKCLENNEFIYQTIPVTIENKYISINWGYDGSGDVDSTGSTIWYNIDSSLDAPACGGGIHYVRFNKMVRNYSIY